MTRKKTKPEPPLSEIETYRNPRGYWLNNLVRNEPSCVNSNIQIRRYRVTVTEIEEPKEVLIERLQKLWRTCDNTHHFQPMRYQAKQLGIELSYDDFGKDRKKEK